MIQIKNEYKVLFKNDMIQDIKGDVSGDYGLLLIEILKDPSERVYDSEVTGPEEPHVVEEVEEPKIEETPTLYPVEPFNANDDCESLRKAMKGFGTDEKTIIEIISKRSNSQRQELKSVYKQMHGRDLLKDLQSELSGDFKSSIEALMMASNEFDAYCLKKAISGLGTDGTFNEKKSLLKNFTIIYHFYKILL
jgi:annexin A6